MKVELRKIKNINKLEFEIPEKNGVYLLTGSNGCGKTSLLVSLHRLGNQNAFASNFKSPKSNNLIDDFKDAQITYKIDEDYVAFKKAKEKWAPTPRANKDKVFNKFKYDNVVYIKANGDRVEPTQKELESRKPKKADINIIEALNTIFETDKFKDLKFIKIGQGRAPEIYLIKSGSQYYSEKQFSLGELLMLKIVRDVISATNNSLILIDEVEMALHPRVQKRLLKFLEDKSKEKKLTILISTHSSTMVKATKKENIILLENDKGYIKVITPCYASRALGNIDFEAGILPDNLFLVEDDAGEMLLDAMLNRLYREETDLLRSKYNIVPIGGYREVVKFLVKADNMIFNEVSVTAYLDKDVETEQPEFLDNIKEKRNKIRVLPCTPELGVIDTLEKNKFTMSKGFKEYSGYCVEILNIIESEEYNSLKKTNARSRAKDKLNYIINEVKDVTGKDTTEILKMVYSFYVENLELNDIKQLLMPVIK